MCVFLIANQVKAQAVFQRGRIKDIKTCEVKHITKQNHPKHSCPSSFSQKLHKDKRHINNKHAIDNRKRFNKKNGWKSCK